MKLLSPTELKDKKMTGSERVREIDSFVDKKTKELNDFKLNIENKKKAILNDFVSFAEGIAGEKAQLEGDLSSSEEKKARAYQSLSTISLSAEKKLADAHDIEDTFADREEKVARREQKVIEESAKLDEREQLISKRAENAAQLEAAGMKTYESAQNRANELSAGLMERENKIIKREKMLDLREEDIARTASANESISRLLKEEKETFTKKMADEKRLFDDRRATLDRGFAELKSKQ